MSSFVAPPPYSKDNLGPSNAEDAISSPQRRPPTYTNPADFEAQNGWGGL